MYLGIDIGTSSVCAVVLGREGEILYTATRPNTFGKREGASRTQDPEGIFALCESLYKEALSRFPLVSLGVSGQMHGMLYLDARGRAISPLYSWQDERGNLPFSEGKSYAEHLSALTGYAMATGFGATSLFYDTQNAAVPREAVCFVTVGDYIAMRLTGRAHALLHPTIAASVGLFDLEAGAWDEGAIRAAGLSRSLFPLVAKELSLLGQTSEGVKVYIAIGDNQASVYGALREEDAFLVNIGTGSQISLLSARYRKPLIGEVRPFLGGGYLLTGCPLCGGHAYRLLKDFFESVRGERVEYEQMNAWAAEAKRRGDTVPTVLPTFKGTRSDPASRASILGLSEECFNAPALTLGVLRGISGELYDFFTVLAPSVDTPARLVGAGNAVRHNPVLREILTETYGRPLAIPVHTEEAAFGAALAAAEQYEGKSLKHFIKYE